MAVVKTTGRCFTSDREPGAGPHPFSQEDDGARVLQREVGQGEAVDSPIGAHPPLVVGFQADAVFLPYSLHVGVGELHLEGGGLSLKGFLVGQVFADGDFTGCIGR